ncbi:MAG: hypothetical protein WA952_02025, partial [Lewinella sp.]
DIRKILHASCDVPGAPKAPDQLGEPNLHKNEYGFGRINAYNAVMILLDPGLRAKVSSHPIWPAHPAT